MSIVKVNGRLTVGLILFLIASTTVSSTQKIKKRQKMPEFAKVINEVHHSIVSFVEAGEFGIGQPFGSGFFINPDHYIVTNAHVIREAESRKAENKLVGMYVLSFVPGTERISGMNTMGYEIIEIDDEHDVAVLRGTNIDYSPHSFLRLSVTSVPVGTELALTGFPLLRLVPITVTCIAAGVPVHDLPLPQSQRGFAFVIDRPIARGQSGSPVYLRDIGVVVGIASGSLNAPLETAQGPTYAAGYGALGFVRPLSYLEEILKRRGIGFSSVPPLPESWLPEYKRPENRE